MSFIHKEEIVNKGVWQTKDGIHLYVLTVIVVNPVFDT